MKYHKSTHPLIILVNMIIYSDRKHIKEDLLRTSEGAVLGSIEIISHLYGRPGTLNVKRIQSNLIREVNRLRKPNHTQEECLELCMDVIRFCSDCLKWSDGDLKVEEVVEGSERYAKLSTNNH